MCYKLLQISKAKEVFFEKGYKNSMSRTLLESIWDGWLFLFVASSFRFLLLRKHKRDGCTCFGRDFFFDMDSFSNKPDWGAKCERIKFDGSDSSYSIEIFSLKGWTETLCPMSLGPSRFLLRPYSCFGNPRARTTQAARSLLFLLVFLD